MGSRLMVKGMTVYLIILMVTACGAPETPMPVAVQPKATSVPTVSAMLSLTPTHVPTATVTPTTTEAPTSTPTSTQTPSATLTATPSATPLPKDVPPVIDIQAPGEALIGDEVVLNASETFDWDGGSIEFSWVQLHNPDRYTGREYVTGNNVILTTLDGARSAEYPDSLSGTDVVKFVPRLPGNYRFVLSAHDKHGVTEQTIDVLVRPAHDQLDIRGVMLEVWHERDLAYLPRLLERLQHQGVNYVSLQPYVFMDAIDSNDMYVVPHPYDPNVGIYNMSDDQLRMSMHLAIEHDMGVMIKPFVVGRDWSFSALDIHPTKPSVWIENYGNILIKYAEMLREVNGGNVILCIGNDLRGLHPYYSDWSNQLSRVRQMAPSVALTYADPSWNWNPPNHDVASFTPLLDYVGLQFYTWGDEGSDPSPTKLAARIRGNLRMAREISSTYDKPIILTEFGVINCDGCTQNTGVWDFREDPAIDNQEAVDYYEAAFDEFHKEQHWLQGLFIWSVGIQEEPFHFNLARVPVQNDFRNIPVEQVIGIYFKPK